MGTRAKDPRRGRSDLMAAPLTTTTTTVQRLRPTLSSKSRVSLLQWEEAARNGACRSPAGASGRGTQMCVIWDVEEGRKPYLFFETVRKRESRPDPNDANGGARRAQGSTDFSGQEP